MHRDLKSLNILLDYSGNAKLADFGWTRIKASVMTSKIGTYQWMAPEVIAGFKYTEKADVFSFGVILWELATRKPPYYGIDGTEVSKSVYDAQAEQSTELGEPVREFEKAKTEADIKREMKFEAVDWWLDPKQKVKVIANPEKFVKGGEYGSGRLFSDVDPYGSYYQSKAGQAIDAAMTVPNIAIT